MHLRLQPKIDEMKEQVKPALCDFIEADSNYKRLKKDINKQKSKNKKEEDEDQEEPEEEEKPPKRRRQKTPDEKVEVSTQSGKGSKAKKRVGLHLQQSRSHKKRRSVP